MVESDSNSTFNDLYLYICIARSSNALPHLPRVLLWGSCHDVVAISSQGTFPWLSEKSKAVFPQRESSGVGESRRVVKRTLVRDLTISNTTIFWKKIYQPKRKFSWLSMIKMSPRTLCSKASCSPKVLKISLAAGLVLVVLLAVSLALLIHQQSKASGSDGEWQL